MGLSRRLKYERNDGLLAASLLLSALAVIVYEERFDVLSPRVGDSGSLKSLMGPGFLGLVLVLTSIQLLYISGVLHLVMRAFYPDRRDLLKSFFVASIVVFLYSLMYVLIPDWGPYYFVTGPFLHIPLADYVELLGWTGIIVASTTLAIRQTFGFKHGQVRLSMLILTAGTLFLLALAFAEG